MSRKRMIITVLVSLIVGVTAVTGVVVAGSDDSAARGTCTVMGSQYCIR